MSARGALQDRYEEINSRMTLGPCAQLGGQIGNTSSARGRRWRCGDVIFVAAAPLQITRQKTYNDCELLIARVFEKGERPAGFMRENFMFERLKP